jgi:transcriptional regulator with XRE-family HTH domain
MYDIVITYRKRRRIVMRDKELRKLIGSRAKQRRLELGLKQPYVAEKMGVTPSTIQRYEAGTIDNTKKLVLDGLSEALHVSVEWLKGEAEEYETDITDKKDLQIRDAMSRIINRIPFDLNAEESDFSKDLLLLMLQEYELFMDSFQFACKNYKGNTENADIAATIGFESNKEYNEIMFLREITHTVNAFNDMADAIRLYSKRPETAAQRLANLLFEDSESVW